ncbi:hypothetical protein TNCV_1742471 [Trichonephila clavipes]|nr:hypothetical protein TNCV_1742471 [Trichonephila clavipes]
MITVRKHLHKQNIYVRTTIPEPLVTDVNTKRRLQWCHTHKTSSIDKWKKVIWSDESSFLRFSLQLGECTFGYLECPHVVQGTTHLQTSMPSSGFEPRLYGSAVSVTNRMGDQDSFLITPDLRSRKWCASVSHLSFSELN